MFIIIYRPHNELNCMTQHIGPFISHDAAYDFLCTLPALGWEKVEEEGNVICNAGCKYIEELKPAYA